MDIVQPDWFSKILSYSGSNVSLSGFEQGLNLIVETPFIVAAVVGVFLNLVLPTRLERDGRPDQEMQVDGLYFSRSMTELGDELAR